MVAQDHHPARRYIRRQTTTTTTSGDRRHHTPATTNRSRSTRCGRCSRTRSLSGNHRSLLPGEATGVTEGCCAANFSNAGDGVADTAPEAPIPDAKPDWKLLAALDNGLLDTGLLLNASDIDDAGAVAASFNGFPLNALKPDGTCGGRIEPIPLPTPVPVLLAAEPVVGIPWLAVPPH